MEQMNERELFELIDKLNSGNITRSEKQKLIDYYDQHQTMSGWDAGAMGDPREVKDRIWANIRREPAQERNRRIRILPVWYKVAAAVILLGIVSRSIVKFIYERPETIVVRTDGQTKEITLPDGSTVTLNVNSSLSYPATFGKERREVVFDGEGYFEVQSDSLHPFIVSTSQVTIRVLGTAFNLKAYQEDRAVEASLLHGKIEVLAARSEKVISTLKPHEKFVMEKEDAAPDRQGETQVLVKPIDFIESSEEATPVDVAWKEGKFAFVSMPLSDIAREMSRRYDVDIRIENEEVATLRYSATFEKESLNEIFRALTTVKPFLYRKEGQTIVIY